MAKLFNKFIVLKIYEVLLGVKKSVELGAVWKRLLVLVKWKLAARNSVTSGLPGPNGPIAQGHVGAVWKRDQDFVMEE